MSSRRHQCVCGRGISRRHREGAGFFSALKGIGKSVAKAALPHLAGLAHKAVDSMGLHPELSDMLKSGATMAADTLSDHLSDPVIPTNGQGIPGVGIPGVGISGVGIHKRLRTQAHWNKVMRHALHAVHTKQCRPTARGVAKHIVNLHQGGGFLSSLVSGVPILGDIL